ncbi:phosphopantetheine-binding protein [Saccharothrix hoggarensis]|uniref:Phosphopantetheine-binding protein n=1 Tax=Saccharothrix hoggarensis TaxID=913853 RepID=A0ABW3QS90_9PSEU
MDGSTACTSYAPRDRADVLAPVDAAAERLMMGRAVTRVLAAEPRPHHRAAVLTALAAGHLLSPGVVTASVIGPAESVRVQLETIVRHVPDVSHVAVHVPGGEPLDRDVVDQLDLAGIGLSVVGTPCDAVFGANLVVVTGLADPRAWPEHLTRGAVVVNATGRDLPDRVVREMNHVVVDDLALVGMTRRRLISRAEADLRQVVTGERTGRTNPDRVLLVELLGVDDPGPETASEPGGPHMSIENEVRTFVVTTFAPDVTPDQLPSDLDLLDTGVVDSLGLLRLIAWVGERYDIPVDEQDLSPAQFSSVDAISTFIREGRSFV